MRAKFRTLPPAPSESLSIELGSDSSTGFTAGAGIVAAVTDMWAVRLGYDYFDKAFNRDADRLSLALRFNWP